MFSSAALARRKQDDADRPPSWLASFLVDIHVPTAADFRRLRSHIKKRRRIYETNYRDLRHKVYAHRAVLDDAEVAPIVARTSVRELERLLLFLLRFYESMWHLFMNGRRPTLRPLRYSVNQAGRLSLPRASVSGVHRRMVHATEQVLLRAAAQQAAAPDGRVKRVRPRVSRRRYAVRTVNKKVWRNAVGESSKIIRQDRAAQYIDSPMMAQRVRFKKQLSAQIDGRYGTYRTQAKLTGRIDGQCTCPSE
jgi:hypothetical protein